MNCSHSLQSNGLCSFCLRRVEPLPGTIDAHDPERAAMDEIAGAEYNRAGRAAEQLSILWGES